MSPAHLQRSRKATGYGLSRDRRLRAAHEDAQAAVGSVWDPGRAGGSFSRTQFGIPLNGVICQVGAHMLISQKLRSIYHFIHCVTKQVAYSRLLKITRALALTSHKRFHRKPCGLRFFLKASAAGSLFSFSKRTACSYGPWEVKILLVFWLLCVYVPMGGCHGLNKEKYLCSNCLQNKRQKKQLIM